MEDLETEFDVHLGRIVLSGVDFEQTMKWIGSDFTPRYKNNVMNLAAVQPDSPELAAARDSIVQTAMICFEYHRHLASIPANKPAQAVATADEAGRDCAKAKEARDVVINRMARRLK